MFISVRGYGLPGHIRDFQTFEFPEVSDFLECRFVLTFLVFSTFIRMLQTLQTYQTSQTISMKDFIQLGSRDFRGFHAVQTFQCFRNFSDLKLVQMFFKLFETCSDFVRRLDFFSKGFQLGFRLFQTLQIFPYFSYHRNRCQYYRQPLP